LHILITMTCINNQELRRPDNPTDTTTSSNESRTTFSTNQPITLSWALNLMTMQQVDADIWEAWSRTRNHEVDNLNPNATATAVDLDFTLTELHNSRRNHIGINVFSTRPLCGRRLPEEGVDRRDRIQEFAIQSIDEALRLTSFRVASNDNHHEEYHEEDVIDEEDTVSDQ
jgi:hypothetical protein